MAPKRSNAREGTPSSVATSATATPAPAPKPHKSSSSNQSWDQVVLNLTNYYLDTTPQRTKLIDSFMAFLAVVGALQFVYCILAGNYVSLLQPQLVLHPTEN
jgi:oligosaccharyltransferase complex subunit epsilon